MALYLIVDVHCGHLTTVSVWKMKTWIAQLQILVPPKIVYNNGNGQCNQLFTKIWGQNTNAKMPSPKTPTKKNSLNPQNPNTKVSGISVIGVLSMAFTPNTFFSQASIKPWSMIIWILGTASQNTRKTYQAYLYISYSHAGIVEMGKLFELGKLHSSTFRQFPVG